MGRNNGTGSPQRERDALTVRSNRYWVTSSKAQEPRDRAVTGAKPWWVLEHGVNGAEGVRAAWVPRAILRGQPRGAGWSLWEQGDFPVKLHGGARRGGRERRVKREGDSLGAC